ncbi:YfbM family protein [Chryseobacterium foetidum]|uniref:YfbM family protein n=1 Tax=Chryseobacterium foetidum TaxID=2951057 RepID=UPI0021C98F09|nr:YfbM family protein [Chryseobacterium foetidum]
MGMIGNLLRVTNSELENYLKDSTLLEAVIYEDESENENLTDIDKAWEGIIFLLTGEGIASSEHRLTRVLFSGQLIDEDQDLGYGPAHFLKPDEVLELHYEISKITIEDLKQRFNPEKMSEEGIYPEIWEEGEDAFDYLAEEFVAVQKTFAKAAQNSEAIITFIN